MGGGGKTSTSTQQVSIPPEVMARYNAVNARAESVANTPFQQYSTNPNAFVAPLTQTQQAGIAGTNQYAQAAQPYYGAATRELLGAQQQGQQQTQAAYQPLMQGYQTGRELGAGAQQYYTGAAEAALPFYGAAAQGIGTGLEYAGGLQGAALGQAAMAPFAAAPLQQYGTQAVMGAAGAAQPANIAAMRMGLGAARQAQPYYQAATQGTQAALQAGQPFQGLATQAALTGSQAVSPEQFSGQAVGQYMSPFLSNVLGQTMAAQAQQNAQQRRALTGEAIKAGAFGGDRSGIAQANLAYQQNLANQQTIANLLQSGYGQALGAFQQQQGVNLAAEQANRAAQQQLAQQALAIGQQGYGQQMGTAQQMAGLGQALFGQGTQGAQTLSQLGQTQYGQQLGAGQVAGALGQQLYGQGMTGAQFLSGLGQQGFAQNLAAAQQQAALGQGLSGLGFQTGQALQGLGGQQAQLGQATAAQQAALAQQGYGMGAGTAQALAGLGQGAQAAGLQGAQAQLGAGQMQQQTEQAGLQALYNQFLQEKGYPFQVAQFLANIAMGTGALSGSTTTTTQPAPFFSDERVKDNIEPIGKTFDGQNIVKFNYKGSPQKQIGLIAQDVEKHHPDAVGLAGGVKTVDYDAATREAAERGRDSEGGAVTPMRAGLGYARGGYAMGGSSAFDQDMIRQILANQAGQYAQMYGQSGTPRGMQGTPGMPSRVPGATLPVGRLATAGSAPQQPSSGMAQGMDAVRKGAEIASMLKQGKEGLKYLTGGVDEKGNKIPSLADRARAFGQPEQGPPMPPSMQSGSSGPRADASEAIAPGLGGGEVKVADAGLSSANIENLKDLKDTEELTDTLTSLFANRGGRMMRALGGATDEEGDISAPEGLYKPEGAGINIPDDTPKNLKGPEAAKAPSQSGKGAGDFILDAAKLAAMVFLKDGGAVKGYANGGLASREEEELRAGLVPLTGEVLPPVEKSRPEGLAVLATRDTGTTSDAKPVGLGAGTTPNEVGPTGLATKPKEPNLDELFEKRILKIESGNRHIDPKTGAPMRSSAGAIGIAQVMPGTAPEAAAMAGLPFDADRYVNDEEYNKALGKAYYKAQYQRFGDPVIAAAAYNAGPKRVQNALAKAEETGRPYTDFLPRETQNYIAKFTGASLQNDVSAGTTPGMRAPGVAGPGRGGTPTPYNSPYATLMNKILPGDTSRETRDIATSENFWVPLLAGVGTMLSTKSPYLGTAIGEGLVGATGAYTGLQKQQADIAQTQASTEQTFANIVKDAIKVENGRVFIRAVGPQGYYFIPFNEWWALDPKDRPKLDPRVESYVSEMAPVFLQADQAGAAKAKPAVAPAGTTTGPAAAPATPAAPGTQPVSPGAPVAPAAAPAATPPATTKPAEVRTSVYVSPQQASEAKQITYTKSGWSQQELDKEPDYFKPQDEIAKAVTNQMQILTPLAGTLASLPTKGSVYTSGKLQEVASPVMGVLNNLAAAAGNPSLISDPKQLTNQEEVKKLVNQLQQAATSDTQQRAFAAFREMAEGLPSLLTSPGGQARLMPQILAASQRELDRNNFFVDWAKAAGGDKGRFSEWAKYSSREANRAFDNEYNNAYYARERDALERMFKDKIKGTDTSVLAHVSMNAASLTPKQKESIRKEYGDRILRYFGVQ